MPFLLGTNFQESRLVKRALGSFYGIGPQISSKIMARFHLHPMLKVGSLRNQQLADLTEHLSKMKIEGDLRKTMQENIRRLRDMGTYRGRRHYAGLPVRGQRTRSQIITARKLNKVERRG